jgi:hypothetical protein
MAANDSSPSSPSAPKSKTKFIQKFFKRSPSGQTATGRKLGLLCLTPDLRDDQVNSSSPDIVAIHGICGDPEKTWTHDNNTLWLRDLLPKAIVGARVFSFGYDAEVALTKAKGKIDDYARSLLHHLEAKRSREVSIYPSAHFQKISYNHLTPCSRFSLDPWYSFATVWGELCSKR